MDSAFAIAKDLNLDMAGSLDIFFHQDIGIAKAAQIARAEGLEVISITNIK